MENTFLRPLVVVRRERRGRSKMRTTEQSALFRRAQARAARKRLRRHQRRFR